MSKEITAPIRVTTFNAAVPEGFKGDEHNWVSGQNVDERFQATLIRALTEDSFDGDTGTCTAFLPSSSLENIL